MDGPTGRIWPRSSIGRQPSSARQIARSTCALGCACAKRAPSERRWSRGCVPPATHKPQHTSPTISTPMGDDRSVRRHHVVAHTQLHTRAMHDTERGRCTHATRCFLIAHMVQEDSDAAPQPTQSKPNPKPRGNSRLDLSTGGGRGARLRTSDRRRVASATESHGSHGETTADFDAPSGSLSRLVQREPRESTQPHQPTRSVPPPFLFLPNASNPANQPLPLCFPPLLPLLFTLHFLFFTGSDYPSLSLSLSLSLFYYNYYSCSAFWCLASTPQRQPVSHTAPRAQLGSHFPRPFLRLGFLTPSSSTSTVSSPPARPKTLATSRPRRPWRPPRAPPPPPSPARSASPPTPPPPAAPSTSRAAARR
ncbi:hypothetical protein [Oryza sativa Japonica Group]|uniref:Uncharacterized protein n=1 Tax=Oryza sativa subsp. japonica TaxID=39947 RepID=Q5QMR1_ORYSJ|nr:hypothetical protein [Oryza sativa Japonica Group]BAD73359.1 hypothetical protein [Oryza sativa Japonica Group]